jgi:hypothetical protein
MAAEWYYAKNKQRVGPVTEAQLQELVRSGELSRSDMVWKQGMAKWMQAGQVPGLFEDRPPQAEMASVPPPLPASPEAIPVAARSAPTPVLPWPAEERSGFSVKQWIGLGASGFMGFVGLVFVVVSLIQEGQGLCCGPMVFCVIGLVLWMGVFNGWMIHGRWVPVDGAGGWVELLKGGIFKREDGMVGTFTLLRNKRFIDIFVAGRLVDSWKILSWGMNSLEVQDMTGKARSFKRGKTLEQKQASPFHRDRTDDLPGSWVPIDGSGQWVQFTKDGAIVFSDGAAGRYTVTGEEPNEIIRATMADGSTREYRVMSLSKAQLVIVEGTEARTYARHGTKTTAASPTSSEQAQVPSEDPPADQGASSAVGGFFSGIWNWLSSVNNFPCPKCKSKQTEELTRQVIDRRQEVKTDWAAASGNYRPQAVFNITTYESECRCKKCGEEWIQQHEDGNRA